MRVAILAENEDFIPRYQTEGSACMDLRANISEDVVIFPGCSLSVSTGISLEIPKGYEAQIRSRSGMALNKCVAVLNSPGTIDSDFRGEVAVILINHGKDNFVVKPKMRIAQLVLSKVERVEFVRKSELTATKRGGGSFGHTGTD